MKRVAIHDCPKGRFRYILNPKVASSTIILNLNVMLYEEAGVDHPFHNFRDISVPRFILTLDRTDTSSATISDGKTPFTFSYFRDPVARIVSAYDDKFAHSTDNVRTKALTGLGRDPDHPYGFDDFVDDLAKNRHFRNRNPHWRPQWRQMQHATSKFDFLGNMSNFDETFPKVLSKAFGKEKSDFLDTRAMFGHQSAKAARTIPTVEQIAQIKKTYARDYVMIKESEALGLDKI